jgi:hypothetical protein
MPYLSRKRSPVDDRRDLLAMLRTVYGMQAGLSNLSGAAACHACEK